MKLYLLFRIAISLVLILELYCVSYIVVRPGYLAREEVCDSNIQVVAIPNKNIYAFYLPLIQFDRYWTGMNVYQGYGV